MLPADDLVDRTLVECATILRRAGIETPPVTVTWDLKGRGCLGRANYRTAARSGTVRLNTAYFEILGDEYASTIAHEYGHVVDMHEHYKRVGHFLSHRSHGPRWKQIMRTMGHSDSPYATSPREIEAVRMVPRARRVRVYEYVCVRCATVHGITQRRHEWSECCVRNNSTAALRCRCEGTLRFTGRSGLE